jgi:hypothetical protein
MADCRREELDMLDWELEAEPERIARRSPIEEPCCTNPANFTCVPSLERDPDTGYFEGNSYQCGTCGTRICEEDYAALVEYTDRLTAVELVIAMRKEPAVVLPAPKIAKKEAA